MPLYLMKTSGNAHVYFKGVVLQMCLCIDLNSWMCIICFVANMSYVE
jgi:hypothetical protein